MCSLVKDKIKNELEKDPYSFSFVLLTVQKSLMNHYLSSYFVVPKHSLDEKVAKGLIFSWRIVVYFINIFVFWSWIKNTVFITLQSQNLN